MYGLVYRDFLLDLFIDSAISVVKKHIVAFIMAIYFTGKVFYVIIYIKLGVSKMF